MPELRELIRRKREGRALTAAEIDWLVDGAVAGSLPDYQLAAWLMACCFMHLDEAETSALTMAFVASGAQLDWSGVARPVVDKHSTGGVGDKVSLALTPWLASAGLALPKMSGRGLGHTGGTLDKLAAIPDFNTKLDQARMAQLLGSVGCCIAGQSPQLVPADKLFYALRDATETVDELGLITASIMGKKLACGAAHIVLDVKCGNGAFFQTLDAARDFARLACRIGAAAGRTMGCVITAMNQPLGWTVGNALEVQEAAGLLSGARDSPELREACLALGAEALALVDSANEVEPGVGAGETAQSEPDPYRQQLLKLLHGGAAWDAFQHWIAAQGGDWAAFERDAAAAAASYRQIEMCAPQPGWIVGLNALMLGQLACDLGAGRRSKEDEIDPWVGIECLAKVGDRVEAGQVIARVMVKPDERRSATEISKSYLSALRLSDVESAAPLPVLERIRPENRDRLAG